MGHSNGAVTHDGRPPLAGTAGALVASLLVVALVAESATAASAAVFGAGCVGVGLWYTEQGVVTLGVTALFGAVLSVGIGRDPLWLLLATVPVIVVWGTAGHAVRLARHVGRTGKTVRVELVHCVSSLVVVALGGGVGYLLFQSVPGTTSLLGVALLFASVVAATLVLR